MNKNFNAYDVTGFLDASIGSFLYDIEGIAIEMANTDDYDDRHTLLTHIQQTILQCNAVLR